MTNQKELTFDYTSNNPLEIELLHLNLITNNQCDFIKQFQRAFLRHKELNSSIQLIKVRTTGGRPKNQIEEIADDSREYWGYLNKLGDKNANILEYYFCSNLTMRRLRDKYTKKEILKETVRKKKKKNKNKNNKIITKEIERIKEHFNEVKLVDDLMLMLKILDKIEGMIRREEEEKEYKTMIKKLKSIVEREGKIKIATILVIDIKTLNKILSGYKKYSFEIYERVKNFI
jgi:hypothetical protein